LIDTIKSVEQNYKWIIYRLCFENYQNKYEIINTETADQIILDSDVAGPEFGELEGHMLIISIALYGLRTFRLHWHERFSQCLREMGFEPCKAEPDIWMRGVDNFYEYIAVYIDDLCITSKDPKMITDMLTEQYGCNMHQARDRRAREN
jgi:hypothetical protein